MHLRWQQVVALGAALLGLGGAGPAPAQETERLNVLLLMGDDHAAYALGCYGSPFARTPNLDKLAASGMLFQRAFCNAPVCTPSRQSLLTGKRPHAVGVTLLSTPLSEEEWTLADHLKLGGYRTAAFGKMHFNSRLAHGFDLRLDAPEHQQWLRQRTRAPLPPGLETLGPWRPMRDPAEVWLNAEARPFPARDADMDATFYAERAAEFIQKSGPEPFFLVVSFTQPHSPFHFPVEYAGRYKASEFPVPPVYPDDPPQIPLIFRNLTAEQKKGITAAYHTAVEYLDAKIGRVLAALQDSGKAKNTLVIYAGDHGYLLGHHGRFEKHSFWEEAVRTPLLVRWPGKVRPGKRSNALVELVDLFPTVAEACRLPIPPDRHGQSLVPLLTGQILDNQHREFVVSQYHENEEAMIRNERYKLVYGSGKRARTDGYRTDNPTPGRTVRLYDLQQDPEETRNLADDALHRDRVDRMKRLLLQHLESTAASEWKAPAGISGDDRLDWYLVPPETRAKG